MTSVFIPTGLNINVLKLISQYRIIKIFKEIPSFYSPIKGEENTGIVLLG